MSALTRNETGVLAWALTLPRFSQYQLLVTDREPPRASALPQLTERDLDDALMALASGGYLRGERVEGDGTLVWWSNIEVLSSGLIALGEWDLENSEGLWRRRDAAVLRHFSDRPLRQGVIWTRHEEDDKESEVAGIAKGELHSSLRVLTDVGYLDGQQVSPDGWADLRATPSGRERLQQTEAVTSSPKVPSLTTTRRSLQRTRHELWATPVGQAFEPFSPKGLEMLRRFIAQAERLKTSTLVAGSVKFAMSATAAGDTDFQLDFPGDEAVQAATLSFRSLYRDEERASFEKTKSALRKAASARTTEGEAAVAALDQLARDYRALLRGRAPLPHGLFAEGVDSAAPRARRVIELWLNGEHFHWDADKARELAEYEVPELLLYTYIVTIKHASAVYDALAEMCRTVVEEPTLHPR